MPGELHIAKKSVGLNGGQLENDELSLEFISKCEESDISEK